MPQHTPTSALFSDLIYQGASTQQILDLAQRVFKSPAYFYPLECLNQPYASANAGSSTPLFSWEFLRADSIFFRGTEDICQVSIPISLGDKRFGYAFLSACRRSDCDKDLLLILARSIALAFSVEKASQNIRPMDLLDFLLSTPGITRERLAYFFPRSLLADGRQYRLYFAYLKDPKKRDILQAEMASVLGTVWTQLHETYLLFLCDCTDPRKYDKDLASLRKLAAHWKICIVISAPFDDLTQCSACYEKMKGIPNRLLEDSLGKLQFFENYRDFNLYLRSGLSVEELLSYCHSSVLRMREYDHRNATHYYDTLYHYLDCNRNIAEVAGRLGIHYNTVQYRLSKMQELFSFDLSCSNTFFQIMLSYHLLAFVGRL